jgi:hypothetical protein
MPPSVFGIEVAQPLNLRALLSAQAPHTLGCAASRSHLNTESGDGE